VGYAAYVQKVQYGRVYETAYLNEDGNYMINRFLGYAYSVNSFQGKLNLPFQEFFFDEKGNPCQTKNGYFGIEYAYDNGGRQTGMRFLDADGERMSCREGYSRVDQVLSTKQAVLSQTYYDEYDHKMIVPGLGYCTIEYTYNKYSQKQSARFLDINDEEVLLPDGYSSIEYSWSYEEYSKGLMTQETYYIPSGMLAVTKKGYSAIAYFYNENFEKCQVAYLDTSMEPILSSDLYAITKLTYSDGKIASRSYYDAQDNPVLSIDGYHNVTYLYNEHDLIVRETYEDIDGKPIYCAKGYAVVERTYNQDDLLSEEIYMMLT
jgi:YD repeat-containing protein